MFSDTLEMQPVENTALRDIFKHQIPEKKKRFKRSGSGRGYDYGWIYTTKDCHTYQTCRTYQSLFAQIPDQVYFTPNTFYRDDQRAQETLRWLNAFVLDVDTKNGQNEGLILPDLLHQIDAAGLPQPSMVVSTPSGGYHVYFILSQPRRAYRNAVQRFQTLQRAMAEAIGGDLQAIGAERIFRIPTPQNIIFRSESRPTFEELNDWYWINVHDDREKHITGCKRLYVGREGVLRHPAFQRILEGVECGMRDTAAYTLALAFKVDGYEAADAEGHLLDWNQKLLKPLKESEIKSKVRSAYRKGAKKGPKASIVNDLSGIPFFYGRIWESAKPREQRQNSHFEEWADDIIRALAAIPDHFISGSQRKLAEHWGLSLSSFQHVMRLLIISKRVSVEVVGKGRAAKTCIQLIADPESVTTLTAEPPADAPADSQVETPAKTEAGQNQSNALARPKNQKSDSIHIQSRNVPSSNTDNLDAVVGGRPLLICRFLYRRYELPGSDPP